MKLHTLVFREIFERKSQLLTSFLAILLGITVIVSIKNISFYSEKAVARELDALGANILVLPKSATLQNYYSADMQDEELPEEYVTILATSGLEGLDNISPKLSAAVSVRGTTCTLTGILPKQEFQSKAAWEGAGIFSRPAGCGVVAQMPGADNTPARETLVRKRVIDTLQPDEALVGSEVAASLSLKENESFDILGRPFRVTALLPQTGTVDDSRIFAHLHSVQELLGKGPVINAVEIVGCCQEISRGLVAKLNQALPDAKVVTVAQVVDTQIKTNSMMAGLSLVFLSIIVLVGGASIANYMYANVYERRREIGTLLALGASPSLVVMMFLFKALLLGIVGGIGGFLLGTVLAAALGPRIANVPVFPMPMLLLWAVLISAAISLVASLLPARNASRLDPCATLQEG
ncbi:MAG: ABC transporter permease [Candidatus Sumerlaeaceae bacterium]|nr:ABC transporter permease [Candidatus Sumerlaeaceae bacterium]